MELRESMEKKMDLCEGSNQKELIDQRHLEKQIVLMLIQYLS